MSYDLYLKPRTHLAHEEEAHEVTGVRLSEILDAVLVERALHRR